MKRTALLMMTAAVSLPAIPANAMAIDLGLGILKRRKKEEPADRVSQLVTILQSDPDEKRRLSAAAELRSADPRTNADVMPTLIGALQRDPSSDVRMRAVQSIGEIKLVSQPAGIAMEAALLTDPDSKVRDAIKASLWQYHLNGYRTPAAAQQPMESNEPPFAARPSASPKLPAMVQSPSASLSNEFRPITNTVGKGSFYQPTAEPPLAKPAVAPESIPTPAPMPMTSIPTPQPMPSSIPTPLPQPMPVSTPVPEVKLPSSPSIPIPPR